MAVYWYIGLTFLFIGQIHGKRRHPMENEGMFEGDMRGIDLEDRNAIVDESLLWPGGVVYYEISNKFKKTDYFMDAFYEIQNNTCLRFKERTYKNPDYVKVIIGNGCWSDVGRVGGEQELSLEDGCWDKVSVLHEFGHALGFWHEHSRSDRDDYVSISLENVKKGQEFNFKKLKPWENNLLDEKFDFMSIMLYGEYAFSKDDKSKTIRAKDPKVKYIDLDDKTGLSKGDIRRINKLYECFGNKRPERPDVPDFFCDFEKDLCDMKNKKDDWIRKKGTLGGRKGSYIYVNAPDIAGRSARIVTPTFQGFGRDTGCFAVDVYLNGDGAGSLYIMYVDDNTSKTLAHHVTKKDKWERLSLPINFEKYLVFTIDAHGKSSGADGIIALDNMRFSLIPC